MSKVTKYEILSSAKVGIEFEFFSEKPSSKIIKDLGKLLNKKIIIPESDNAFDKDSKGKYHSEFEPTATIFKLEKDFSGGPNMKELITGPLNYEESRLVIIKLLDWIKINGWTDKKCAIHLNISFNYFMNNLKNQITHMNVLKFILTYDEKFIYTRFPERENSVYARSINQILPLNKFTFLNNYDSIDSTNYSIPDEKYYGVNFTKKVKNYLEFRYLGGKGYEYKTQKILEILDYSVLKIYDTLQNPSFTSEETLKLKRMLVDQRSVADCFSSPELFFFKFPKINVFVDMRANKEILKSFWTTIRESLFSVVINGGMKSGIFNYDTDISISQLRYVTLRNCDDIKHFEFFDCDVEGSFEQVVFFRTKIRDSRLNKCKLIESNDVYDSKVEHTNSYPSNILTNCYINSPEELIEGKIEGGVIRNAILGKNAHISKRTLVVNSTSGEDKKSHTGEDKNNYSLDDKKRTSADGK